ncbi:hypothetical protein ACFL6U_20740 [Planctomycetota bacterium]
MKSILTFALTLVLMGCSGTKQVTVETNPRIDYFPGRKKATVIKSMDIDLDAKKQILLVPVGNFTLSMVERIGYFDVVLTPDKLEEKIMREGLADKAHSIADETGINIAAKEYQPFLWLRWVNRFDGTRYYVQLVLTDPILLEDYFVCETHLDYLRAGVSNRTNWYPMMNSLISYIKRNSKMYGH